MQTDPKPQKTLIDLERQSAARIANPDRPQLAPNFFEMQRWMLRVLLEQCVLLGGQKLKFDWPCVVQIPEFRRGEMRRRLET